MFKHASSIPETSESETASSPSLSVSDSMRRRATIASVLGNALEWFDFVVYGLLSAMIARLFFPSDNPTNSVLLGFATLGISFVARPIGGLAFGIYADRYGRKKALTLIFCLMALGTLMIAFLPTYASIGIAAPLTLVLARMIQGFSAGGEFGSATATLIEFAPKGRRGLYGSFQMVSQIVAILLASLFVVVLTKTLPESALTNWGWRLPFLVGVLVGPVGVYLRHRLSESPEFQAEVERLGDRPSTPFRTVIEKRRVDLLASLCLVAALTAPNYVNSIYLPNFAVTHLGMAQANAYRAVMMAACVMGVLVPFTGWLSDYVSRRWVIGFGLLANAVLYPILFARFAEAHTFASLLQLQLGSAVAYAFVVGPAAAQIAEIFPVGVRSVGVSLAYNIAVMLFGGMAPFILAWFGSVVQDIYGPVYFLASVALLGLIGLRLISLSRERHPFQCASAAEDTVARPAQGQQV